MSLITRISQHIQHPADVIQFAKDGKYEESWILSVEAEKPSSTEIEHYVNNGNYDKLIVEYIWNSQSDEKRYVLTVIQDKGCLEQNKYSFVQKCLTIFYNQLSFEECINKLDEEIVGHAFLLKQAVQKVRLGIFNHWFSVGPIEMWNSGDELSENTVATKIKNKPEIFRSHLNYQGLAFIYNFDGMLPGPYHVLKTPTCHKAEKEWVVDVPLVYKTMKMMLK